MSPERPVAYILGTFPQASQTFIAREVRGLRQAGLPLMVFALKRRRASLLEPEDQAWYDQVRFVPLALAPSTLLANLYYLTTSPSAYLRTLAHVVSLPHRPRWMALRAVTLCLIAAWIARRIEDAGGCRQVHAHFALAQTEVAMAVASLVGCPFSFTAHARDIYAAPSALPEKMREAATVVTCTGYNADYLRALCPDLPPSHVRLVHHGVPLASNAPSPDVSRSVPLIVAAGRLIDKKGFDTLVDACAALAARQVTFTCRIYGTGPGMASLRQRARDAGLADRVEFPGWAAPEQLRQAMTDATVFTMPSRIARGGDRDGIPNVVLEAMAASLPVVATDVSGIPEAVVHEQTGLLVEPDNAGRLADALQRVLADASAARAMGMAGRQRVLQEFTIDAASSRLVSIFGGGTSKEPAMMNP